MLTEFQTQLLSVMMMVIMLGMGASLTFKDFAISLKKPTGVAIGLVTTYLLTPIVGVTLATYVGPAPCLCGRADPDGLPARRHDQQHLQLLQQGRAQPVAADDHRLDPVRGAAGADHPGLLLAGHRGAVADPARERCQGAVRAAGADAGRHAAAQAQRQHRRARRDGRRPARRCGDPLPDRFLGASQLRPAHDHLLAGLLRRHRPGRVRLCGGLCVRQAGAPGQAARANHRAWRPASRMVRWAC